MKNKNSKRNTIEPTSYIWHSLFVENKIPANGIVIEVAPGHEPKIGHALSLLGFKGTIFLIEPDQKIARYTQKKYRDILPKATVRTVTKTLQDLNIGVDVPANIDALVASHPFDDMVISYLIDDASFFSHEREDGVDLSAPIKKLYDSITDKDYECGISATIKTWKDFIKRAKPNYFIASQYPSYTLGKKGLAKRQNSGFAVLRKLKKFYKNSLIVPFHDYKSFGFKAKPKWWIIAKNPHADLAYALEQQPFAIKRLGKPIFVLQRVKSLCQNEYDVVYIDNKYLESFDCGTISKQVRDFAVVIDNEDKLSSETTITYADRQKDKTDIGLSGNHGSGRAVYYGDRFNVLGIGKTTLCKSTIPSHSTGRLELVGAMRRIILSNWINYFTHRAPAHPVLIVLKETARFKWNSNPIPLALLVRVDDGSLDRPSHVEQYPQIIVDFQKTLAEYARLDAEYFAYRILLGAWSTSNYSLGGHVIDLESASFAKYRGPYHTSSSKHPHTLFGYEGFGFLEILHQLADVKNIEGKKIENLFYKERRWHLGLCFLLLLGVAHNAALTFFSKHQSYVIKLTDQFENLAKKISPQTTDLNLYMPISESGDPSLLDMSNLFRNLAKLYGFSSNVEREAFKVLIRKTALSQVKTSVTYYSQNARSGSITQGKNFHPRQAVVTNNQLNDFLQETKSFISSVFQLLMILDSEKCLDKKPEWNNRLQAMNQDLPTMFELNSTLKHLAESYRLKRMSSKKLGIEIEKLCKLPNSKS